MRILSFAAGLGLLVLSSTPAFAVITQVPPTGTAASSLTALFQISSDYLGGTGTQPFAAAPFTLIVYVPDQVSYYHPSGSLSANTFFLSVSGDYTNDGVTTAFSNQDITFSNGAVSTASFTADNFLTAGDRFTLDASLDGLLFTSADAGNGYQIATFNPGNYQIDPNSYSFADYNSDPQFTGGAGASVTPTLVPEPGSAALLLTGALGLALTLSRKRKPGAALMAS